MNKKDVNHWGLSDFLLSDKNIKKNGYMWTLISGMLNAVQSVVWLMVIRRVCEIKYAGIFSIAYAVANLMMSIGKYGVKNYQVTDIYQKHSFSDYFATRIVTCVAMIVFSISYVLYCFYARNYTIEKMLIIILFCIMKMVDAIEEVYYGDYQQKGRIDIGAKSVSLRYIITTLFFIFFIFVSKNFLITTLMTLLLTIIISFYFILITRSVFNSYFVNLNIYQVRKILLDCFALFAGYYLSYYLGNISKYAIDRYMSEEIQACFNFIFMPVFFVNLLSTIIFQPILSELANHWKKNEYKKYNKLFFKQIGIILIITVSVAILGYIFGISALSILFNTDLKSYRLELEILLIGGGLLALSAFLVTSLTVIRCQNQILVGYGISVIIAKLFEERLILNLGIRGASILYTTAMLISCIIFSLMLYFFQNRKMKDKKQM